MKVSIRKIQKGDALKLASIDDDDWKALLSIGTPSFIECDWKRDCCYVAEIESNLVGFIYGFLLPNGTLIPEMIYVHPDYRTMGIGTMLLEYLEKESGCTHSMIFYNKSLRNYYKKRGYSVGENLEVALKELILS